MSDLGDCGAAQAAMDDDDDDEVESTGETSQFDMIVGYIEDILISEQFQGMQNNFLERYYNEFNAAEENKLSYTNIFKEYQDEIELYVENMLKSKMPEFKMNDFIQELERRQDELNGEVFEVLFTFSDFLAFKDMILDYRASKNGEVAALCLEGNR